MTAPIPSGWAADLPGALPHPGSVDVARVTFTVTRLRGHTWRGHAFVQVFPDFSEPRRYPHGRVQIMSIDAHASSVTAGPAIRRRLRRELLGILLTRYPQYRRADQP